MVEFGSADLLGSGGDRVRAAVSLLDFAGRVLDDATAAASSDDEAGALGGAQPIAAAGRGRLGSWSPMFPGARDMGRSALGEERVRLRRHSDCI